MSLISANDHPNPDSPDDPLYYAPRSVRTMADPRSNATRQTRSDHLPPAPPLSRFDEMREEASAKFPLIDLVGVLQELHAKQIDLYLHQQGIDTTTPSGKAMFQMMGVFAEFERSMVRERVMAGLSRAKAGGARLGRPATVADDAAKVQTIRAARAAGKSIRTIAREQGVGIGTVSRLAG